MFIISQLILKFWFAKFIFSYSSSASKLAVTIDVSYTKPSDFFMDPPNYRAGSSITLTCRVEGVTYGLTYSWSSTCTHNCFVRGMTTQSVTRHGLRSMDSGTHTCNAADVWGHSGTATIVMNITGKALALKVCASVAPTLSTIFLLLL